MSLVERWHLGSPSLRHTCKSPYTSKPPDSSLKCQSLSNIKRSRVSRTGCSSWYLDNFRGCEIYTLVWETSISSLSCSPLLPSNSESTFSLPACALSLAFLCLLEPVSPAVSEEHLKEEAVVIHRSDVITEEPGLHPGKMSHVHCLAHYPVSKPLEE